MADNKQDSTTLDRLAALKLLRENMFYAQPSRYALSDIAEDLPGAARAVAPLIKNVLPTAAIVSRDPEERKQQIREAIARIKASGKSDSALGKEILHNVKTMGVGSLAPGFLLASAVHLLGFRSPKIKFQAGKVRFRSPITPGKNIRRLFSDSGYAKHLLADSASEALVGAGMSAAAGVAYPLVGRLASPSDKALAEAGRIMQNQPYVTSTPSSEILSVLPGDESSPAITRLKNTAMGTGLGAAAGLAGGFTPTVFKALGLGLRNAVTKRPLSSGIPEMLRANLKRDLPNAVGIGAGLGGLSGAFTDRQPG